MRKLDGIDDLEALTALQLSIIEVDHLVWLKSSKKVIWFSESKYDFWELVIIFSLANTTQFIIRDYFG